MSQAAFFDGFQIGCLVAAGVLFAGVAFAARFLAARPTPPTAPEPELERAPALETAGAAVGAGVLDWVPCLIGFSGNRWIRWPSVACPRSRRTASRRSPSFHR